MRTFDFSPLYRSTVGFDRLLDILDSVSKVENGSAGYPPYNIERTSEDAYRISVAVAGFAEQDLAVEVQNNVLLVSGGKTEETEDDNREFLHRGIAGRSFERRFQLADHVEVTGASLENGLLNVDLERRIPDTMKPRRIEIGSKAGANILKGPRVA
ncbi:MAG: Hsp20 family protein [Pseudomonadota bacterium]